MFIKNRWENRDKNSIFLSQIVFNQKVQSRTNKINFLPNIFKSSNWNDHSEKLQEFSIFTNFIQKKKTRLFILCF